MATTRNNFIKTGIGFGLAVLLIVFIGIGFSSARAEVVVNPKGLGEKIKEYLIKNTNLGDSSATLQVESIQLSNDPVVLKGNNLTILMQDSRLSPMMLQTIVTVTLTTEEETRTLGVPVRLAVEKPVWVASRLIRSGQPVTAKDVILQTKKLSAEALYAVGENENVTAYTSTTNIEPGKILDSRNLHKTPLVYRNDEVHLVMSLNNGVNVSVLGKALEDGPLGSRIKVIQHLQDSKVRIYTGEVVSKNTVVVQL